MTRSIFASGIRGLLVAGVIGGAAITGLGSAQAAPDTGSSAVITAAGDCQAYWPSPYTVCGQIRDLYNTLGGPSSTLSVPAAAQVTNPDGSRYSTFIGGTIHWSPATGAYVG